MLVGFGMMSNTRSWRVMILKQKRLAGFQQNEQLLAGKSKSACKKI